MKPGQHLPINPIASLALVLGWVIVTCGYSPASIAALPPQTYYLLVFSNPVAGTEAEYNDWYDKQHAPDVVSVPGFVSAQRYIVSDEQLRPGAQAPTRYLVVFRIETDNLGEVYAEVNRRNREHLIAQSDTFDRTSARNYTYRAITAVHDGARGDAAMAHDGRPTEHYLQLVFSDAAAGKDSLFNRWYDTEHAPQVASTPGFESWQRARLAETQLAPGTTEGGYLAMFNIVTTDVRAVFDQFRQLPATKASNPGDNGRILAGYTYKAIGPLLDGTRIRAERAAKSG
jgi:hypothetical protein